MGKTSIDLLNTFPPVHKNHMPSFTFFCFKVLEQGTASTQAAILLILHCTLHYIDINSLPSPTMASDLIYTVSKFVEVRICINKALFIDYGKVCY